MWKGKDTLFLGEEETPHLIGKTILVYWKTLLFIGGHSSFIGKTLLIGRALLFIVGTLLNIGGHFSIIFETLLFYWADTPHWGDNPLLLGALLHNMGDTPLLLGGHSFLGGHSSFIGRTLLIGGTLLLYWADTPYWGDTPLLLSGHSLLGGHSSILGGHSSLFRHIVCWEILGEIPVFCFFPSLNVLVIIICWSFIHRVDATT